jgi:DNA-directed RNA polymerase subunit RPC12/RpoP
MKLVVVETFMYPHEANMAKGKLESHEIVCSLQDELTTQINNFYSNAIGGVKLVVREEDAEKAKEILNTDYSDDLEIVEDSEDDHIGCRYCGSKNVGEPRLVGPWALFSTVLAGFPLPFIKKKAMCFNCGKEF